MAFVNLTSIMFNSTAGKVTASARYFEPWGDATFGGSLPSELKLYWLWQRNWKKESRKTLGNTATYISCTFVQYVSNQACAAVLCLRHYICQLVEAFLSAVADPDLQMGEGGGGVIQTPQISGGPRSQKKIFFFGLKTTGAVPPGPLLWLRHC